MLPNGYITSTGVLGVYDSGIPSQNGLTIDALYVGLLGAADNYLFGSRNANSNSSAGQLNAIIMPGTNNSYFGYGSGRTQITPQIQAGAFTHIHVNDGALVLNTLQNIAGSSRTTATFTGTRNMYVGALNNAGAILSPTHAEICGFIVKQGNSTLVDLEPAYREADGVYGLYDHVSGNFLQSLQTATTTHYIVDVASTAGGIAFARTLRGENVSRIVGGGVEYAPIKLVAEEKAGYSFKNWTDSNGTILSKSTELDYVPMQNETVTANFEKNAIDLNMGYRAKVLPKDFDKGNTVWMEVLSASIYEDTLQKQTSTFQVADATGVNVGNVFYLYSPRGESIYSGIISEINGNEISCREPLSVYDQEYMFLTTLLGSNITILYASTIFAARGLGSRGLSRGNNFSPTVPAQWTNDLDLLLWSKTRYIKADYDPYRPMSLYYENNLNSIYPNITEAETSNLEDKLLEMAEYGIYYEYSEITGATRNGYLSIKPKFYKENDSIQIGDNLENISNIEIVSSGTQNTVVTVYNSTGSTLRGMYAVTNQGDVLQYNFLSMAQNLADFIGYDFYMGNVVMSDDKIEDILTQNLASEDLNHKITFDIVFNDMIPMSKLKVGTPVNFYVGSKLYKTVVTALSYEIRSNNERIQGATITLGNVRTNLTSKLNMRKANASKG